MQQSEKGNQWHSVMRVSIGVDAGSELEYSSVCTEAYINNATQVRAQLDVEKTDPFADAGYQGVSKHQEMQGTNASWHVVTRPSKRKALDKRTPMAEIMYKLEQVKTCTRVKVEHLFRVIEQQFGHLKVRLALLFALSNPWMVRKQLLNMERGECALTSRQALRGVEKQPQKVEIHLCKSSESNFHVVFRSLPTPLTLHRGAYFL